jgi:hypothetical protein
MPSFFLPPSSNHHWDKSCPRFGCHELMLSKDSWWDRFVVQNVHSEFDKRFTVSSGKYATEARETCRTFRSSSRASMHAS